MQIEAVTIRNLRSIAEGSVSLTPLTALIGENNVGKSTILRAIELFFEAAPKISVEDFSFGRVEDPIEITIMFNNLTPQEISEFGSAVVSGKLMVHRELRQDARDSGQYTARAMVFPGFGEIRDETNGSRRNTLYRALQKEHDDLPDVRSHTEIDGELNAWEQRHPDALEDQWRRGFFGAQNVANGKLRKKTSAHLVSAVLDSSIHSDQRRSPLLTLLSEVARQTIENRQEVAEFLARIDREFSDLVDPENFPHLARLSESLTSGLQHYYADTELRALWENDQPITTSYPSPRLVVAHQGATTDLERVGHGLQRAALFAIVQFLAERLTEPDGDDDNGGFREPASDIILLIEEPEIYQHPAKSLVIYRVLKRLVHGFSQATGIRLQVIYTTHSEKFIQMKDFDSVRIVRRLPPQGDALPKTMVSGISISNCSHAFANYFDPPRAPMSNDAFVAKLHIFGREVCEGFFAKKVVIVEGVTDKAIIEAAYESRGRDVHGEGVAIIAMEGKTKMDKPTYIFTKLGIPTYLRA